MSSVYKVRVRERGFSASIHPRESTPGKRGEIKGWSPSSARRLKQWLQSNSPLPDGQNFTCTLTLAETPASAEDFSELRRVFLQNAKRSLGVKRLHWVMEFTRRGVPHLHCFFTAKDMSTAQRLVASWLGQTGGLIQSQDLKPMYDLMGWQQYVSKHVGRSETHYQRQGMPPGWEKSGRVWGKFGEWQTHDETSYELLRWSYFQVRREMKKYALAQARSRQDWKAVSRIRRWYNCGSKTRSQVTGAGAWAPAENLRRVVDNIGGIRYIGTTSPQEEGLTLEE